MCYFSQLRKTHITFFLHGYLYMNQFNSEINHETNEMIILIIQAGKNVFFF